MLDAGANHNSGNAERKKIKFLEVCCTSLTSRCISDHLIIEKPKYKNFLCIGPTYNKN